MDVKRTPETRAIESPRALGLAVREFRLEAGMTQAELGTALGVSRKLVERIERGEVTEQVRTVLRAFALLNARIEVTRRDA